MAKERSISPSGTVTMKLSISRWTTLPSDRRDKSFWLALNEYLSPLLQPDFPLASEEFYSLPFSGRSTNNNNNKNNNNNNDSGFLNETTIEAANELREYYDDISLWNPLSLSFHLGIGVEVVIEQLLLAKEYNLVSMRFIVPCKSCGCDVLCVESINEICFRATYHKTNVIRCPMCTERTEVTNLADVGVFFHEPNPPKLLVRKYHRLFYSEEVKKRRLETFFCPPGASFSFRMLLPEGCYLLIASSLGLIAELHVKTGAEYLEKDHSYHSLNIYLEKLLENLNNNNNNNNNSSTNDDISYTNNNIYNNRPIINVKHGKLIFKLFNGTPYGGYLDICVAFDERLEFIAPTPPLLATVPLVLHHTARGLRSPLFYYFIPSPPGTRTTGVYVLHSFALSSEEFDEPIRVGTQSSLAVIREVHRYSLEDHHGLLLSVGLGGSMFESSFLTFTSALASSLCFAQRVVTRLGEEIAGTLSCCITEGEIYMVSFQQQYDDIDNVRSAYPDVNIVGPVIHASMYPSPVVMNSKNNNNNNYYNSDNNEEEKEEECKVRTVRFELRSVSCNNNNIGTCLRPEAADEMLSYFLSFISEQLEGVKIVQEPQALVVVVPLSTLNAKVMLPALLDPSMYTKTLTGPFA